MGSTRDATLNAALTAFLEAKTTIGASAKTVHDYRADQGPEDEAELDADRQPRQIVRGKPLDGLQCRPYGVRTEPDRQGENRGQRDQSQRASPTRHLAGGSRGLSGRMAG